MTPPPAQRGAAIGWTPTVARWAPWAALFLAYLLTATRHLVGADNGEFVILAAECGRAHPPGYPLYTLYLQAMSWLPAANPIHASALATALLGWGSVVLLYRAARAWGASGVAAMLAALFFALSPQVWFLHTHAEAFALNNLAAAAILWLAAPKGPLRGGKRLVALGLVAGLGLANHHSIILTAPVGFYGLWLGWREARRPLAGLAASGVALAAGLLPYLYILDVPADGCLTWGNFDGLSGLVDHFLRRDYGTTRLDYYGGERKPLLHLWTFAREMSVDFLLVGVLLGLAGAAALWTRRADLDRPRIRFAVLVATFLLCGPVFISMFNRLPEGAGLEVARRFYALPMLVATPFIAFGFDYARRALSARKAVALAALTLLAVALTATSLQRLRANYHPAIDDYARHTLEPLPDDAILLGEGDARFLSIQYARLVEDFRRDVAFVHPALLRFDWYLQRTEERLGVDIPHAETPSGLLEVDSTDLLDALVATDRPIFWANPPDEKLGEFAAYPFGTTQRVLPPGAPLPSAGEIFATNRRIYDGFDLGAPPPRDLNPWGWWLYAAYPHAWFDIAELCEAEDNTACARRAESRAQKF